MKKVIAVNTCSVGFILNGVLCSLLPSLVCQTVAALSVVSDPAQKTVEKLVEMFNCFSGLSGCSVEDKLKSLTYSDTQISDALSRYSALLTECKKEALPGMALFLETLHKKNIHTFTTTSNDLKTAEEQTKAVHLPIQSVLASEHGAKPHLELISSDRIVVIFDAESEHRAAETQFRTIKKGTKELVQIGFIIRFNHAELFGVLKDVLTKANISMPGLDEKSIENAKLDGFHLKPGDLNTIFEYTGPESLADLEVMISNRST